MSDALDRIAEVVLRRAASALQPAQHPALRSAIVRALPNGDAAALLAVANPVEGPRAIATLIDEVTIKETFFFRDRQQLDTFRGERSNVRKQRAHRRSASGALPVRPARRRTHSHSSRVRHSPASPPRRPPTGSKPHAPGGIASARCAPSAEARVLRRRRPAPEHRHLRSAQPRHGQHAAARRDGFRPDRLPECAHLLRRRDRRPGDRRASEHPAPGGHADPGIGDVLCGTARRLVKLKSIPARSSPHHPPRFLSANRSGSRERTGARSRSTPRAAFCKRSSTRKRRGVRRSRVVAARPISTPRSASLPSHSARSRGDRRPEPRAAPTSSSRSTRRTARPPCSMQVDLLDVATACRARLATL